MDYRYTRPVILQLFCAFLLIAAWTDTSGQQSAADSLLQLADEAESDTVRARLFFAYASKMVYSDPAKALEYAGKSRELYDQNNGEQFVPRVLGLEANCHYILGNKEASRSTLNACIQSYLDIGDEKGAAANQLNLGILYKMDGQLDSTMALIGRSLALFEKLNDTLYRGNAIQLRGTIYQTRGYQELALQDFLEALRLHRAINAQRAIAEDLMTLSNLYSNIDEMELARDGFEEAAGLYEAIDNQVYKAQALTFQGAALSSLGQIRTADSILSVALELSRSTRNASNEARTLYHIAVNLCKNGKWERAKTLISEAIAGFESTRNIEWIGLSYLQAFRINEELGFEARALKALEEAEKLLTQSESLSSLIALEEERSAYLVKRRSFEAATASLERLGELRDSLRDQNNEKRVEELKIIHDLEKKEQELQIQAQDIQILEKQAEIERSWRFLLIAGLIMLVGLIAAVYYGSRQKLKRTQMEKERSELELAHKKRELTTLAVQLAQRQSVLEEVRGGIRETGLNETGLSDVMRVLNRDLDGDPTWNQFITQFEDLNPNFVSHIRSTYPEITSNETRLMALIKLNLGTHDIANLLNISKDGVKKARYRLRKKLRIEQGDDLDALIQGM